ncbi:helix-turn-helix domain-containing protein [Pseudonocardia sp. CA-142604]|uniref:helix-turn-helix domain-containing protein n=1 Tax=Pseudonocardia sp. CA-142604 TaxID=3240024 RepID=UPI003D8E7A8E
MAPDTEMDDVAGRSVVRSVFALLRELREETGPIGVSTLARRTGLPKSTVQRLLMQMAAEGAVERVDRAWTVGPSLGRSGPGSRSLSGLRYLTRPRLRRIAMSTGASTFLLVGDGAGPVTLDQVSGSLVDPAIPPEWQMRAAAHPASAASLALTVGGTTVERGSVVPEYECLATVFPLASGSAALLSATLPLGSGIDRLASTLDRVAETINAEAGRLASDGW